MNMGSIRGSIVTGLSAALVAGCAVPMAVGLYEAATIGGGVVMGVAAYNATDDADPTKGQGASPAPAFVDYRADLKKTRTAILEVFAESNDTVENVTDGLVKTKKAPYGAQPGAFQSLMGKGSVSVAKTLTLSQEAKGVVRVTLKVDLYRTTPYTSETQEAWPEYEGGIRAAFFDRLNRKLPFITKKL